MCAKRARRIASADEGKLARDAIFRSLGTAPIQSAKGKKTRKAAKPVGRPTVALCMIVRNEERNLGDCLACVHDLVDEIVVVDTGSSDRTKEIAGQFGARVFDFPWVDSFAAARNESLRHARSDWIFWMDADDRIDEANRLKLKALFGQLDWETAGYVMTCRVLPGRPEKPVRHVDHTRLFRNHPQVRWHYRVHEQILPSIFQQGGSAIRSEVVITHVGYVDRSLSQSKLERNVRLMRMDFEECPHDPFTLYNLGRGYERMEQTAEAVRFWRRSLECAPSTETYVPKLYSLLAQAHQQLGQRSEMLSTCLAGLARFPDYVDLLYWTASVLYELGDLRAAEACLLRLLKSRPEDTIALGDDPGIRGYKSRNLLGRIYRDLKRPREAEAEWRSALAECPNFPQALLGWGQLLLDQGRWEELDQAMARLDADPLGGVEAAVLRGLKHAVRKEYAQARELMEATSAAHPRAIEPLVLLGRVLMRIQDYPSAEQALRKLLTLDPGNSEARRGLARLMQQ